MARTRTVHRCRECGASSPRWTGRCPGCGEWNTLVEEIDRERHGRSGDAAATPAGRPLPLADVDTDHHVPAPTGVRELDRVLGGGLVPGSATLLGGEPGIGKSTLLLQALAGFAARGRRCLYVSAEESAAQVRARAERLRVPGEGLWIIPATSLGDVRAALTELEPDVCAVDSVQTVYDPELESAPGSVAQVRQCAHELVTAAKSTGTSVVLVGHVTKEGALAGPRVLEHVVDTVLSFEGDRHHALRLVRATKHRFGPTGELGLFEMTGSGLIGVDDPSGLFLDDHRPGVPGCVVLPAMEGDRPLLVEVQTLVTSANPASARRSVQGLDGNRLSLLLAVMDRRAHLRFSDFDVYASVVGGVRVTEPAADLAVAVALASVRWDRAVPEGTVVFGEVGLGGEIRQVAHAPRRLAEAARLGSVRAIVPRSVADAPDALQLVPVGTVAEAIAACLPAPGHGPH